MKNLIRIPENKEEMKVLWNENKKRVIGGVAAVGALIAGVIFAHGRLTSNGSDSDDTAGCLPDCGNDEDYRCDPDDEENEEETDENEADAE